MCIVCTLNKGKNSQLMLILVLTYMCVAHTSNSPKLKVLLVLNQTTNHTKHKSTIKHIGVGSHESTYPNYSQKPQSKVKN